MYLVGKCLSGPYLEDKCPSGHVSGGQMPEWSVSGGHVSGGQMCEWSCTWRANI